MIRETVAALIGEVQHWRRTLGISQNEYARRCGIDASILSRVLRGEVVSGPAEKKMRAFNQRQRRKAEKAAS